MAQPEPPGLKLALSHASHSTPAKPIARPSTREGVNRSFSQIHAISAPHSGVDALKIDDSPAVIDSAAKLKHRKGSAEFRMPTMKIGF